MRANLYWLGLLLVQGCQPSTADQPSPAQPSPAQPSPESSGTAKGASIDATSAPSAAASARSAGGKPAMPPEARRNSAPEGIADTALGIGKKAPPLKDIPATTGTWSKSDKTTVLVFYRGFW